jgi:hypothetical protein
MAEHRMLGVSLAAERGASEGLVSVTPNNRPSVLPAENAPASWPERRSVVVQTVNSFRDQGDRFVVRPPEDCSLNRLAERLRKLIPMVTAKDSRRFHELRAAVSQALAACGPSSRHRLLGEYSRVPEDSQAR